MQSCCIEVVYTPWVMNIHLASLKCQVKMEINLANKLLIGRIINIAETAFHKAVWKMTALKLLIFAINIFLL